MGAYSTEQEEFWRGEFGDAYTGRNIGELLLASNVNFFTRILQRTRGVTSVLELGANLGMNLRALRTLLPSARLSAVEINAKACEELRGLGYIDVTEGSILDYRAPQPFDLVLIKGVLIHINPERLDDTYRVIDQASSRYVVIGEYYNPTPTSIPYRGHTDRLFKRDFAGEMLDRHPRYSVVDYGFAWRRDPVFPQDDITWFLLEKR